MWNRQRLRLVACLLAGAALGWGLASPDARLRPLPVTAEPMANYEAGETRHVNHADLEGLLRAQRATVGLCAVGESRYLGTGVLVAQGTHVLTAAHVQRRSPTKSAWRPVHELRVVLDPRDERPDLAPASRVVAVRAVHRSSAADVALWELAHEGAPSASFAARHLAPHFGTAGRGTRVAVVGQAYGLAQVVSLSGRVLFPARLPHRLFERTLRLLPPDVDRTRWHQHYVRVGDMQVLQHPQREGGPAIGFAGDVARGMSGGPVLTQRGAAWIGMLVDGQPDRHRPYEAGWRHHEIALPMRAIAEALRDIGRLPANWMLPPADGE